MLLTASGKQHETMSAAEMMAIAAAVDVCTKHQIGLLCPKCQQTFHGQNATTGREWIIACGCREIRADMGHGRA